MSKGEVEVKQIDEKTYYVVKDPVKMRKALGALLAEVQAVKSEGNYEGAKDLVESYGKYLDEKLRDEVIERYSMIEIPKHSVAVMPRLVPIYRNGELVDIFIDSNESYLEQQLRYGRFNEINAKQAEKEWQLAKQMDLGDSEKTYKLLSELESLN
jgi:dipeptidyl-peptidase-3